MWPLLIYGGITVARFALGVAAVRGRSSSNNNHGYSPYRTGVDLDFYP